MSTQTAGGGAPAIQRVRVSVTYVDGGGDSVVLRPVGLVAAERHFAGQPPAVEGTLYAAWWQLSREQHAGGMPTFGDWLDSLDTIAEAAENPTPAAPPEQSQPSPSRQAKASPSSSSSSPSSTPPSTTPPPTD